METSELRVEVGQCLGSCKCCRDGYRRFENIYRAVLGWDNATFGKEKLINYKRNKGPPKDSRVLGSATGQNYSKE